MAQADRAEDAERGFTNGGPGRSSSVGESRSSGHGNNSEGGGSRPSDSVRGAAACRQPAPCTSIAWCKGVCSSRRSRSDAWLGPRSSSLAPHLPPALAAVVYAFGALVCHQRPERSFHWDGAQLAVCARCTGIYLGACVTAVLAFVPPRQYASGAITARRLRTVLAVAALPTAVTVACEWAGWWHPSARLRAATGLVLGAAAGFVVAAALAGLHYGKWHPRAAAPRQPPTHI